MVQPGTYLIVPDSLTIKVINISVKASIIRASQIFTNLSHCVCYQNSADRISVMNRRVILHRKYRQSYSQTYKMLQEFFVSIDCTRKWQEIGN
jgi:hypothetical protein